MRLASIRKKQEEILNKLGIEKKTYNGKVERGVTIRRVDGDFQIIDEYFVDEPISKIKIVKAPELGEGLHYFVEEAPLNEDEYNTYQRIVNILSKEFESPTEKHVSPEEYVFEQAEIIAEKYRRSLGKFTQEKWDKIFYYVVRDLIGYGPLQAIMGDPNIEDASCNGLDTPVFIWHRRHESIPTNITFTSEQRLNDFIVSLAHRSSKHISSAQPILDAMLPEKHRLAATFMKEVSTKGSTFCIRKFSADPFSVIDLIKLGTLDAKIAAYFWLILENKKSFMLVGGTGAGKTSTLNALLSLMSQNNKIVTVEEVPELSPPVANWTQLNIRENFDFGSGSAANISLFDLIKVSLRYRPDYIIVGEVRGEEAYVLFQALATGHGGLCTMHADSVDRVVKRLTSPPMNVSEVYIPLMNIALYVQRVELLSENGDLSFGRRIRNVSEIVEFENYLEVAKWDPRDDSFNTWFEDSYLLKQIAIKNGISLEDLLAELENREKFIAEIVESGVREQRKVAEKILSYYTMKRQVKKITKEPVIKEAITKEAMESTIEDIEQIEEIQKEVAPYILSNEKYVSNELEDSIITDPLLPVKVDKKKIVNNIIKKAIKETRKKSTPAKRKKSSSQIANLKKSVNSPIPENNERDNEEAIKLSEQELAFVEEEIVADKAVLDSSPQKKEQETKNIERQLASIKTRGNVDTNPENLEHSTEGEKELEKLTEPLKEHQEESVPSFPAGARHMKTAYRLGGRVRSL